MMADRLSLNVSSRHTAPRSGGFTLTTGIDTSIARETDAGRSAAAAPIRRFTRET